MVVRTIVCDITFLLMAFNPLFALHVNIDYKHPLNYTKWLLVYTDLLHLCVQFSHGYVHVGELKEDYNYII